MEKESFDNLKIAEFLNRHFVCIKLDREKRPDIEEIYMTGTQLISGHGGWPMSNFLTPDGKPFFADLCSYLRYGPGMLQVLEFEDDIATNRRLMGATNPAEAAPGTIRADFAESIDANAVHGSDAPESAAREIAFFFSADELQDRDA